MKAAYVVDTMKTEIKDIPVPNIKPNEVLIKTKAVGICGSDLHVFLGAHAFRKPPVILGHEISGDIYKVGEEVTKFKVGDRVAVNPTISCGKCEYCLASKENICPNRRAPGTTEWVGTFVEYFPAPENIVYKIPDDVDYGTATLAEPLSVAMHILGRLGKNKDSIAILGCGTIGLLTLFLAKRLGYKKIICSDPAEYNRITALRLGADMVINPLEDDVSEKIFSITKEGVGTCVVAAGPPNILDQATEITKKGGDIGLVAMITNPIPVNSYNIVYKEQNIYGSQLYTTEDFEKALDIINSNEDMSVFITQRLFVDDIQHAMEILHEKRENVIKIIIYLDKNLLSEKR